MADGKSPHRLTIPVSANSYKAKVFIGWKRRFV